MPSLGERIDLILAYGIEGNDDLESLRDNLEQSGEATEMLLEKEKELREQDEASADEQDRMIKAYESRRARQEGLNSAMEEAQEILQDNALRLENLRLEYEDGNISSEEYNQGLQELRGNLEQLDVPSTQVTRKMRQLAREQRKAQEVGQLHARDVRSNAAAFRSLFGIIGQLPNGVMSFSQSLPMLTQQLARLNLRGEQSRGMFGEILNFLKSPTGLTVAIAAAIPLVAQLAEHFDLLNSTLADGDDIRSEYSSQMKEIFDQFRDFQQEDIGTIEGVEAVIEQVDKMIEEVEAETGGGMNWLQQAGTWVGTLLPGELGESAQVLMTFQEDVEARLEFLNNLREKYIAEGLALRAKENSSVIENMQSYNSWAEVVEKAGNVYTDMMESINDFELDEPQIIDDSEEMEAKIQELNQRTADKQARIGKQRLAFEKQLETQRIQLALSRANEREAIAIREEQRKQQVRDNEIITARQRQQMLTLIEKQAAEDRKRITEDEEMQKRQMRQRTVDTAFQLMSALQGFGQVIHGQSEERAKKAFEVNKRLQLAMAIANGARAVVEALPNLGLAALVGSISAANIAKIAATKFQGGGARGRSGQQQITYRGIDTEAMREDNQDVRAQSSENEPRKIEIVDGYGNLVMRGQEEIDQQGGDNYLRRGQS